MKTYGHASESLARLSRPVDSPNPIARVYAKEYRPFEGRYLSVCVATESLESRKRVPI